MPAYDTTPTSPEIPVLTAGRPITLWNAEAVVTGGKSLQFALHRDINFPSCFSVELEFSANPGAFEIAIQTADQDVEKYYVAKGSITSGLNGSFVGRIEVVNVVAKFARLSAVLITNAVNVTARVF